MQFVLYFMEDSFVPKELKVPKVKDVREGRHGTMKSHAHAGVLVTPLHLGGDWTQGGGGREI